MHPKLVFAGVLLTFATITTGCQSVTHVTAPAPADALKRVAAAAADYTVTWVDGNTLRISDAWVFQSIVTIGYWRFCADLAYADGQLDGDFYLRMNHLPNLFITITNDTGPGPVEARTVRGIMRAQMEEILYWAGVAPADRTVTHGPPGHHNRAVRAGSCDSEGAGAGGRGRLLSREAFE